MLNKLDKLTEATMLAIQGKLTESKYYEIMATNRGMWNGMTTPMKTYGKYIIFTNKDEASRYLDKIASSQGNVNNFNSYHLQEIDESDIINAASVIVDTVEDLEAKSNELGNAELENQRNNVELIKSIQEFVSDLVDSNKSLIEKSNIKYNDNKYRPEVTIYLVTKSKGINDLYMSAKITSDDDIDLYYQSQHHYFDKDQSGEVMTIIEKQITNLITLAATEE